MTHEQIEQVKDKLYKARQLRNKVKESINLPYGIKRPKYMGYWVNRLLNIEYLIIDLKYSINERNVLGIGRKKE